MCCGRLYVPEAAVAHVVADIGQFRLFDKAGAVRVVPIEDPLRQLVFADPAIGCRVEFRERTLCVEAGLEFLAENDPVTINVPSLEAGCFVSRFCGPFRK